MNSHEPLWKSVAGDVCAKFGVSWADIAGRNRSHSVSLARSEFCGRCRAELGMTTVALGKMLGRDHTTAMYLADKYLSKFDPYIAARHTEKSNRNRVNSINLWRKKMKEIREIRPPIPPYDPISAIRNAIAFNASVTEIIRLSDGVSLAKGDYATCARFGSKKLKIGILRSAWILHTGALPDGCVSRVNPYSRSLAPENLKCNGVTAAEVMQSKERA